MSERCSRHTFAPSMYIAGSLASLHRTSHAEFCGNVSPTRYCWAVMSAVGTSFAVRARDALRSVLLGSPELQGMGTLNASSSDPTHRDWDLGDYAASLMQEDSIQGVYRSCTCAVSL